MKTSPLGPPRTIRSDWTAAVFVLVFFLVMAWAVIYTADENDQHGTLDFRSYMSVCENHGGYSTGRCLFAWRYPEQARALNHDR